MRAYAWTAQLPWTLEAREHDVESSKREPEAAVSAREHLIVVLPGIGGSVLAPLDRPEAPVWSAGLRGVGDVLRHPERLSVGEHDRLEPVGLVKSWKAFGVWTAVRGYDGVLRKLAALPGAVVDDGTREGRCLDASVVAVPYDFRLGVADAARHLDDEVAQRLKYLWPGDGATTARVVIVAHSMGGLVARYWLGQQDNWRNCRALITLGTPHRGAPKALDVLANGIAIGPFRARRPVPVLREWPSVAELLPRYPAVVDEVASSQLDEPVSRRPHELPLPWLRKPALAGLQVHQEIEAAWERVPRDGPEMVARIGYGHGTLRACSWDGRRVHVTKDPPAVGGLGRWADDLGDGTVPAFSGLPLELDRHSPGPLRVALRHGTIAELHEVVELVETYEGRPARLPVRGEQRPVMLGLDVDEVQQAGQSVEITAAIVGVDADVSRTPVWVTVDAINGRAATVEELRLEWDAATSRFRGSLSGRSPGLYRVRVTAEQVPRGGDLGPTEEVVEVLDGADID